MNNSFIMMFSLFVNLIAILVIYNSFGRKADKQKRLINTLIGMGAVYIIVLIVYFFSSLGIEKTYASDQTKTMLTLAFVPVNAILFIPFLVISQRKAKEGKIARQAFSKRIAVILILAVVVIISEFFYFRNFQKNMLKIEREVKTKKTEQKLSNEISNSEKIYNRIESNYIINNENTTINKITNNN